MASELPLKTIENKDPSTPSSNFSAPYKATQKMQTSIKSLLLLAAYAGSAAARATVGVACDTPGTYDCTDDFGGIAVCNGRWLLAAQCGVGGLCVWPAGSPTPWCHV